MRDSELFDDAHFWSMPSNVADIYKPEEGQADLEFGKLEAHRERYNVATGNENGTPGVFRSKVSRE